MYYDPHEGETNEANVVCLSLVWSEHDILSRAERRKLQEGLYLMNYRAMEKAMLVTNETFPDLKVSFCGTLVNTYMSNSHAYIRWLIHTSAARKLLVLRAL